VLEGGRGGIDLGSSLRTAAVRLNYFQNLLLCIDQAQFGAGSKAFHLE
jgi:hypothetical protein